MEDLYIRSYILNYHELKIRHTKHCTAVSTLLSLISSEYHHWRAEILPLNTNSHCKTSVPKLTSRSKCVTT